MLKGSAGLSRNRNRLFPKCCPCDQKKKKETKKKSPIFGTWVCSLMVFTVPWLVRWNIVTRPGWTPVGIFLSESCCYNPTHTSAPGRAARSPWWETTLTDFLFIFFFKHSILAQVFSESQKSSRCSDVISGAGKGTLGSVKYTCLRKVKNK